MSTHQTSAVRSQAPGLTAPDWRTRGACADAADHDLWFPIGVTGPALQQIAEAKKVCAHCPVRTECLRFALSRGIEFGIFGGLTEDERRAIKRRTDRRAS